MIEIQHYLFQLALAHLTVTRFQRGFRHQFAQFAGDDFNVVDFVVKEVHLAAALDFAKAGFTDSGLVPFSDKSLDGQALCRWCGDNRQVAQTGQGHIQCAWYWCCCQCEQVHLGAQRLELLFLTNTEAVFLVNNYQAEVPGFDVCLQDFVCPDQDIQRAVSKAPEDVLLLFLAAEA